MATTVSILASGPIAVLRLMRPKQWIKNAFVCVGLVFGAQAHDLPLFGAVALAVIAFCLMGSAVYVLNDYLDREADRAHPQKCHRPLASGAVSLPVAFTVMGLCMLAAVGAAWAADPRVLAVVSLYLVINVAYSIWLKHQPVIDVFCIASGFMLRIIAGTWAVHIPPSGWLILTGMFITLFLGFAKRRAEWVNRNGGTKTRRVLLEYTQQLLDTFLSITATGTVLSYGLYTLDAKTIELHHTDKLIYTLPFVLFGLFRYLFLLHSRNNGENPTVDVFTDRQLILAGVAFGTTAVWLLNR